MKRPTSLTTAIISILLCFLLLGCSGYKKYDFSDISNYSKTNQQGTNPIHTGESVLVQITGGERLSGTVDSVNEFDFILDGQQIYYSAVESVQVREFLWTPTIVIGATSAFALFLLTAEPGKFSTD